MTTTRAITTTIFILMLLLLFFLPSFRNWQHNRNYIEPFLYKTGTGPNSMVLLHGLTGTHKYWQPLFKEFGESYTLLAPDLIGFGHSPWPKSGYSVDDQIQALQPNLPDEFILVGHSMGSLIALEMAKRWPQRVTKLVLLAPPSIFSRSDLKQLLKQQSKAESIMALDSFWAPLACHIHETLGPLSFYLMRPFISEKVPDDVVREGTLHRWESYNYSLEKIVLQIQTVSEINNVKVPYQVLVGSNDGYSKNSQLTTTTEAVVQIEGDHNFLWEHPQETIQRIKDFLK